jgi:hypothetical protein
MKIKKVYIGGWFQRTTLHLTEIWDLLKHKKSNIGFPQEELDKAQKVLQITELSRESGQGLEYVSVDTEVDISYRIYEDGLIILEKEISDLKKDFDNIKKYYDGQLSKSLSFLFSKGAPNPKELANIETILPYILVVEGGQKKEIETIFDNLSQEIYSHLSTKETEVYRSPGLIVINNLKDDNLVRMLVESQIFFREFKTQLHRYLTIHRVIWERIATIKEQVFIKGTEIDKDRGMLDDYQKTIDLIGARIKQMSVYIDTRKKLTDLSTIDEKLHPLFQLKFETLEDTHKYISNLWDMTRDYLKSALELFSDLQNKSTKNSISSLQLITTIGVVAGLIGYLGRDKPPTFTGVGLMFLVILLLLTWILNSAISRIYKNKKYELKGAKIITDIKI